MKKIDGKSVKEIVREAMFRHINCFQIGGIDGDIRDILGYDYHKLEDEFIHSIDAEIEKHCTRLLKIVE
jgi:hypothetical protein